MLGWIEENSGLVQAMMSGVTALVWVFYLHIIVSGLRRQRRTEILINLGGERSFSARALVSNLGFEPVYILEIILTVWSGDGERTSSVADRAEVAEVARAERRSPSEATLQGPLKSGEYVDIGSIKDLLERDRLQFFEPIDLDDISRIEITVAAITAATNSIVAAKRSFRRDEGPGKRALVPETLYARQIRSRRGRRSIERKITELS
ncbi:MAG: hypothetical protein ACK41U_01900 [Paracoccus sp. (in: a-proteobacteria)]|uniref:hypothetical protein n=1 Tax=Paracoccus sp. TaxID=267 RepID=UPI00391C1107